MRPHAIYFDFIQRQDICANLYLDLSIHFCDQMDLAWFWVEMAMAEKQRAGLLQFCLENKMFSSELPDPIALRSLERKTDEWTRRVSKSSLSVDEAFDIAVQIETSEIEAIRNKLTSSIQGPMNVQEKKREVWVSHTQKLCNAAERFAVSPAIQMKIARLC